jgi:putative phosphoesterase
MKIGIISDTHGHLDPKVLELFQGVSHIIHAGDIGFPSLIVELSGIAPVTAVLGNNDDARFGFKELEVIEILGSTLLVHHIVEPGALSDRLAAAVLKHSPHVIVFGHTHRRHHEILDGRLFLNPGYSGRPRHQVRRSVAVMDLSGDSVRVEFLDLDGR